MGGGSSCSRHVTGTAACQASSALSLQATAHGAKRAPVLILVPSGRLPGDSRRSAYGEPAFLRPSASRPASDDESTSSPTVPLFGKDSGSNSSSSLISPTQHTTSSAQKKSPVTAAAAALAASSLQEPKLTAGRASPPLCASRQSDKSKSGGPRALLSTAAAGTLPTIAPSEAWQSRPAAAAAPPPAARALTKAESAPRPSFIMSAKTGFASSESAGDEDVPLKGPGLSGACLPTKSNLKKPEDKQAKLPKASPGGVDAATEKQRRMVTTRRCVFEDEVDCSSESQRLRHRGFDSPTLATAVLKGKIVRNAETMDKSPAGDTVVQRPQPRLFYVPEGEEVRKRGAVAGASAPGSCSLPSLMTHPEPWATKSPTAANALSPKPGAAPNPAKNKVIRMASSGLQQHRLPGLPPPALPSTPAGSRPVSAAWGSAPPSPGLQLQRISAPVSPGLQQQRTPVSLLPSASLAAKLAAAARCSAPGSCPLANSRSLLRSDNLIRA